MANAVNWFEIPVTDLERATKFYETIMDKKLIYMEMGPSKMAMFPMEEGAPNATGALLQQEGSIPSKTGSVVYFSVDDIEYRLVIEVYVRAGKLIDPGDDTEGTRDRPPTDEAIRVLQQEVLPELERVEQEVDPEASKTPAGAEDLPFTPSAGTETVDQKSNFVIRQSVSLAFLDQ